MSDTDYENDPQMLKILTELGFAPSQIEVRRRAQVVVPMPPKPRSPTPEEVERELGAWHPDLPKSDPHRYHNIAVTDKEIEKYGLRYSEYGELQDVQGLGSKSDPKHVIACECGRFWTDPREAHCPRCHRQFGGDLAHELHLTALSCQDPAGVRELRVVDRKFGPTWVRRNPSILSN